MRDRPGDYPLAQRAMALQWAADGAFTAGRFTEAATAYQRAVDLMVDSSYGDGECIARIGLGGVLMCLGRVSEARQHVQRALGLAQEGGESRLIALAQGRLGGVDLEEGRLTEALGRFEEAFEAHHRDGEKQLEVTAALGTAAVDHAAGRIDEAVSAFERAAEEAALLGDQRLEGAALGALARALQERDAVADAMTAIERGIALFRAAGDAFGEAAALRTRAALQMEVEDLDAMAEDAERARRMSEVIADRHGVGLGAALLGVALARRDDMARARHSFDLAGSRLFEHPLLAAALDVHQGHLDVLRDDRAAVAARIARARDGEGAPASKSVEVRVALRLLERVSAP